jgi:hypothetical protein
VQVGRGWSVWSDARFTELYSVLNGPYQGFAPSSSSSTGAADFLGAPRDLRITSASPAIDRAGIPPLGDDVLGNPVGRVQ